MMTFARDHHDWKERRAAQKAANLEALCAPSRSLHRGTYASDMGIPISAPIRKECASQHAGYMAAVRDLGYCMRCRIACRPQFCHADMDKGQGIKTDVRRGWPGCPECHRLVGSTGYYPKAERRELEADLARRTRAAVLGAGLWPARLPRWEEA